jgi:hypothetical protein
MIRKEEQLLALKLEDDDIIPSLTLMMRKAQKKQLLA